MQEPQSMLAEMLSALPTNEPAPFRCIPSSDSCCGLPSRSSASLHPLLSSPFLQCHSCWHPMHDPHTHAQQPGCFSCLQVFSIPHSSVLLRSSSHIHPGSPRRPRDHTYSNAFVKLHSRRGKLAGNPEMSCRTYYHGQLERRHNMSFDG